jgi:hypothetical protein
MPCRYFTIGAGGGGDVLSAYVVGKLLEIEKRAEFVCGGAIWERYRIDRKPGPRSIDEIENAKKINECLAWMKNTMLPTGVKPTVAEVADIAGNAVGIDITKPHRLAKSIRNFCSDEWLLPIGVDAGGDILARGNEKGVVSPLCDSIMLSALAELKSPVAVVGFGSDGELTRQEIEKYLSELADLDAVIGVTAINKNIAERVLKLAEKVKSHASKIPLVAAKGFFGKYQSWDGEIFVSILNSLVFFVKSEVLYDLNPMAQAVRGCKSIEEANEALHSLGIVTELDLEIEMNGLKTE